MGGILLLLGLCLVMALASFLAGALPLSMTLSQSQLRLLSSIGVGILVGTSMIVIIPEGIEAAVSPAEAGHVHRIRTLVRRSPWSHYAVPRMLDDSIPMANTKAERDPSGDEDADALIRRVVASVNSRNPAESEPEPAKTSTIPAEEDDTDGAGDDKQGSGKEGAGNGEPKSEHGAESDDHEHVHIGVPTFEIGFSMILGFVLMFLIDRLPRHATESLHSGPQMRHISLDNLGGDTSSVDEEEGFLGSLTPSPRRARSLATTTGLVIHAAADGIAMGASSTTTDMKLGLIIFVAIMIHKAPAAFGLTALLLKQGLSKRAARGHLIILDDKTVPAGSVTPTFAAAALHINNPRWKGVPFILKCGKALNERKAEIRIQFQKPVSELFDDLSPNELVLRVQPDEAVYLKMTTKKPGLQGGHLHTELDLSYKLRHVEETKIMPDAYERLILDVVRGDHNLFVRSDELEAAWRIFTPILHRLERERIRPVIYEFGSRGPATADELVARYGYNRTTGYRWRASAADSAASVAAASTVAAKK